MSKVFQIEANVCYWDATNQFQTAESTIGFFPPSLLFIDAPDYVFEGWGYDETKEGDDRFIKPESPEGWLYDEQTGTFYPENFTPSKNEDPLASLAEASLDLI